MNELLTEIVSRCCDSLWRAVWQGTLVIGLAWLIDVQWKSMPSAWRSWMWRLVFVRIAVALLPFSVPVPLLPASTAPTSHDVAVLTREVQPPTIRDHESSPAQMEAHSGDESQLAHAAAALPSSAPWGRFVLCALWLMGVGACVLAVWRDSRSVRRRLRESRLAANDSLMRQVSLLSRRLRLSATPQFRLAPGAGSPCLVGSGRRGAVLLPTGWLDGRSPVQLRLALAHELAHFARGDLAWNRLVVWLRALLFFHPLVWLATRRYVTAQEMACDELALNQTDGTPGEFATLLIQLAEQPAASWTGAAAMMGTLSSLQERIEAMYESHRSPPRYVAWAIAVAGTLCLAPVSLAQQAVKSPSEGTSSTTKTATSKRVSASASASSSASGAAQAFGAGKGGAGARGSAGPGAGGGSVQLGNGFGNAAARARAQAQARANAAVAVGNDNDAQPASPSPRINHASGATRTVTSSQDSEEIKVVETDQQVKVTITKNGQSRDFVAANPQELAARFPEAAAAYRKVTNGNPDLKAAAKAAIGKLPAGFGELPPGFGELPQGLGELPPGFGKLPAEFGNVPPGIGDAPDARKLLRDQLKTLRNEEGVQGTPLEKLLDDLEREIN